MRTEENRRLVSSSEVDSARRAPDPLVERPSISREAFSRAFDRSFRRVYSYVSRRIDDRAICERVVREVLVVNLDLLVTGRDEREVAIRLKASSDQRIVEEAVRSFAARELQW